MKFLKFLFILICLFFSCFTTFATTCKYSDGKSVGAFLNDCKPSSLVGTTGNFSLDSDGKFKSTINGWIKNISLVLSILAVLAYMVTGMMLQFSGGQDESITKAKNSVIWISVGFISMISVSGLIYIVVNIMYSLG